MIPNSISTRRNIWTEAVLIFGVLFCSYGYFFQSGEHNENARYDQIRAIVERGTLSIDGYSYNTADIIQINEHWYPNKPPGATFVGVPGWIVSGGIAPLLSSDAERQMHLRCYLTGLLSVGLCSALLGVLVFFGSFKLTGSTVLARIGAIGYGLGTISFPFATLFFSHQIAATLLFGSFFLLLCVADRQSRSPFMLTVAGFLAGYSVTVEYPTALGACIIGLYSLYRFRWGGLFVALGGVLGGSVLLVYNYLVSGSALFITYLQYTHGDNSPFPGHNLGIAGVRLPDLHTLWLITFEPQRGLFYCNPWLVAIFPALLFLALSRRFTAEIVTCGLIVLGFMTFNAGYGDSIIYWGGGHSIGPRHFIPAIPFLTMLIAPALSWRWLRVAVIPLQIVSVIFMLMAVSVEPRVPYEFADPLRHFLWRFFTSAQYSLLQWGVYNNELMTSDSVAFNLGELLGLPPPWQLVPLIVVWVLFGVLLRVNLFALLVCAAVAIYLPFLNYVSSDKLPQNGFGAVGTYIRENVFPDPSDHFVPFPVPSDAIAFKRVDPQLSFSWLEEGAPVLRAFSVEWKSCLKVDQEGPWSFELRSDDGSAVWIDENLAVSHWGIHAFDGREATLNLAAGSHLLIARYYNQAFSGNFSLRWRGPGESEWREIPKENLSIVPASGKCNE